MEAPPSLVKPRHEDGWRARSKKRKPKNRSKFLKGTQRKKNVTDRRKLLTASFKHLGIELESPLLKMLMWQLCNPFL